MAKKISFFVPMIFFHFVFVCHGLFYPGNESSQDKKNELAEILESCAEYCERLSSASVQFVCREKIVTEIYHYRPGTYFRNQSIPKDKEKSIFVYEFRFKLEKMCINESRALLEENGQEKFEENAQLKNVSYGKEIVFLEPVSFLSEDYRTFYRYRILGRERFKGEKSIVIEVIPSESDDFTVKIWVSDGDFNVLKIERLQKILGDFEGFEQTSEGVVLKPHLTFVSEFLYEQDGFRFPTRHFIREAYDPSFSNMRRLIRSETTVVYKNYKVE